MNIDAQMLKGSVSLMVLDLVATRDMYGYQIIHELETRSDKTFLLKEGTLYPVLHSLEEQGLLSSYWVAPKNGRKRKYYNVTDKGKGELAFKKQQWQDFSRAVDRVLEGGIAYA